MSTLSIAVVGEYLRAAKKLRKDDKSHLPFEHDGMLVNKLSYGTMFLCQRGLCYPTQFKFACCILDDQGVKNGSSGVG